MKNLLIVLSAFVLTSCTVAFPVVRSSSFVDFTKYDGFYLSQAPTTDFKFVPLGIVSSFVKSGDEKGVKNKTEYSDGYAASTNNLDYVAMTAKDAIDVMYKKAKDMGATGILNVQINYIPSTISNMPQYFGYSVSGMAIKME